MKNKPLFITLLITAVLSSLAVLLKFSFSELFGEIICFPFEQIGMGLRWMSLQGSLQNAIAIVIYIVLCLSPLLVFFLPREKKVVKKEDSLMIVLSLVLFYVIYMMINPGLIPMPGVLNMGTLMAKTLFCGTIYSIIVTYFVLRVVRLFFDSETKKLYKYMVALLWITAMLFTISIFGIGLNDSINQIEFNKAANIGTESGLGITYVFTVIQFIVNSIPAIVSIFVIFSGIMLITEFSADPYSEVAIKASENLSMICKTGLTITVCSNAAFNLFQLFFLRSLRNINSFIQVPLFSVVFVLGALIFSKMIMANKTLKDDNDSII